MDLNNDLFATGAFYSTANFNPTSIPSAINFTSAGVADIFTLKLGNAFPTPIVIKQFILTPLDKHVAIKWTSSSEENVSHFEVEKSYNALNFESIATVKAVGNSSVENDYETLDFKPASEWKTYYRLRSVDFDGKEQFSEIRWFATITNLPEITIYPNPVADYLNLQLNESFTNKKIQAQVIDLNGKVIYTNTFDLTQTQTGSLSLPLQHLPSGHYVLKIQGTQNNQISKSFIKR